MNEPKKELAQYLKLNYGLHYKNKNFVPSQTVVDGELELEKYTDQILIYEPIQDNSSNNTWDLFANTYDIKNDDDSLEFEKIQDKLPLLAKKDVKILIPVLRITYFGNVKSSTVRENYQEFLAREVLVGGFLIIRDALLDNSLEFDRLKAHISWAINEARWECKNLLKPAIMHSKVENIEDSNGNPIYDIKTLTDYLTQLYKFETPIIISYEKVVPIEQKMNDSLFNVRLIPGITNHHKEINIECWTQDNIYLNLPFWIKEYQLNHGMVVTSYGLVPGIKPALDFLSVPSIKRERKIRLKASFIRNELLHSKIYIDESKLKNLPFLTLFDTASTNVIQCNIFHGEVVINIWEEQKQISDPSQQLVEDIKCALNDINPYKSLEKVFSEYGHVICTEITMGGRLGLGASTVNEETQEEFRQYLNGIECSEWSDTIILKCKDLLNKLNMGDQKLIAYNNSETNLNELNIWLNNTSEKPNSWSLVDQPKLIPLYEIFHEDIKRPIQNLLENKQKILMTGVTKLSSSKIRYYRVEFKNYFLTSDDYRVEFKNYLLTSDDYQIIGSIIMNNERFDDLSVKFHMKSISGFSIIIKEYKKLDKEIKGDLKVIWQLIGKPKSVGYFSKHTRNNEVFNRELVTKISKQKISLQINVKEELSPDFIIATSIQYPPTNYEYMLQVVVKSWSENIIYLDIINFDPSDNTPDEACIQLYVINPNQQEFVIADFGSEQVLWKLIGHKLGPVDRTFERGKRSFLSQAAKRTLSDIRAVVGLVSFSKFIPLIFEIENVFNKILDLVEAAEHNKRTCGILRDRVNAAELAVRDLRVRNKDKKDFFNSKNYKSLQNLVIIIARINKFISDISQMKPLIKHIKAKNIEKTFMKLCEEFDGYVDELCFSINLTTADELEQLKADQDDLVDYLREMVDGMNEMKSDEDIVMVDVNDMRDEDIVMVDVNDMRDDMNEIRDDVNYKELLKNLSDQFSSTVVKVNTMNTTMEKFMNENLQNQTKIDNIFRTHSLNFCNYEADNNEKPRKNGRVTKWYNIINRSEEFAFKTISEKEDQRIVQNHVTILKELHDWKNIIKFYGLTCEGNKWYLVTEWAEFGNLREFYTNYKDRFNLELKLRISFNIARGLNFLRAVEIVHRDIRAENILITIDETAKLANFKLSRYLTSATLNQSQTLKRVRYCAPELLERAPNYKYDQKCEVYSFGILLWEIAEERIPYEGNEDIVDIIDRVRNKRYREPFSGNSQMPKEFKQLEIDAVHHDPDFRPKITDMFDVLKNCYKDHIKGHPSSSSIPNPSRNNSMQELPPERIDEIDLLESFKYMTLTDASKQHKIIDKEGKLIGDVTAAYKCFEAYPDQIKAKYYKALYISKGFVDCPNKDKIVAELFKEVADDEANEFPEAKVRYGDCLYNGKGVKQNYSEALKYFEKAAEDGIKIAMYNAGNMYYNGNGCTRDIEKAKYYMNLSAYNGHELAIEFLDKFN